MYKISFPYKKIPPEKGSTKGENILQFIMMLNIVYITMEFGIKHTLYSGYTHTHTHTFLILKNIEK